MGIEALEKLGEAAEKLASAIPSVPEGPVASTAPEMLAKVPLETAPEVQAANWELIDPGNRQFETATKPEQLGVLLRVRGENALSLRNQEALVAREQQNLAAVQERLGLTKSEASNQLPSERELARLKIEQIRLERQRRELLREEIRQVWQEKMTATFEVFRQMSPKQLAIVRETGEVPSAFGLLLKFLSALFGKSEKAPQMETRYVIIMAEAFDRGLTTVEQISTEFPQFVELETELEPVVVDLAEQQLLTEPGQKQIEDAPVHPELSYENRPEVGYKEPRQISETSSAEAGTPAALGGGGETTSAK